MEVSEVRRRLRAAIDEARRAAARRRERSSAATRDYERFLADVAVPTFNTVANALAAEGHRFRVFTPADSIRLASERSREDFIELALDSEQDPPGIVMRTSRGRGRRQLTTERMIADYTQIAALTDADVVQFVADEIRPFVER